MARIKDLTDKQRKFVDTYLTNGRNASAAYRDAYKTENMTADSVNQNASKLLNNTKVVLAVDGAEQHAKEVTNLTLESHTRRLDELGEAAAADKIYGAAVRAEELRGKATGLYVERTETVYTQNADQIIEELDAGAIAKALVRHILEGYPADDATIINMVNSAYAETSDADH